MEEELKRSSWLEERSLVEFELVANWRKSKRSGTEEERDVRSDTIPEPVEDEKSPTREESLE